MEHFERKFNTPEKAQTFLTSLSERFDNHCLLLEFTDACVEAQAAMADWLIKEAHYANVQRKNIVDNKLNKNNNKIEIAVAWDDYNRASMEFQMAKYKIQEIAKQLIKCDINT